MKETLDSNPEAEQDNKSTVEHLDGLVDESHDRTKKLIRIRYKLASGQINVAEVESELDDIPSAY